MTATMMQPQEMTTQMQQLTTLQDATTTTTMIQLQEMTMQPDVAATTNHNCNTQGLQQPQGNCRK